MPVAISDAYFDVGSGNAWHTILIGGGRAGGRGLFALEITDPTKFVENDANADDLVLWEFDSSDDPDLGQTFSTPVIAFLNNGRWAAIFGNGYNGTGDGEAKLFILFLDGGLDGVWTAGTDYIEISTQVGSINAGDCADGLSQCNGLSTPQAVDLNGDKVVDKIYAGDLAGNMWPFDLSDPDPSNWKIAYGTVATPLPLFTATHHAGTNPPTQQSATPQPITSKPILVRHPDGLGGDPDILVFFGTGQYLNTSDVSNSSVQTFYGVWDNGTPSLTPADLIEQTFITDVFNNAGVDVSSEIRVTTDNAVNYAGADNGWFLNLTASSGERLIVDPDIRGGLVFFNTWIPDTNVCNAGGSGVLMSVKQSNGGRPDQAAFDLNGDGIVDVNDLVTVLDVNGNVIGTYAPSGEVFNLGLPASSNFLSNKQYTPGTESLVPDTREVEPLNDSGTGRLSWQELRP
jgi:type IV pilus assembly protein PilY1